MEYTKQVCPSCSTPEELVFGTWHRPTSRFKCGACGVGLYGDGYEDRLAGFYSERWKVRKKEREERLSARALRKQDVSSPSGLVGEGTQF